MKRDTELTFLRDNYEHIIGVDEAGMHFISQALHYPKNI